MNPYYQIARRVSIALPRALAGDPTAISTLALCGVLAAGVAIKKTIDDNRR